MTTIVLDCQPNHMIRDSQLSSQMPDPLSAGFVVEWTEVVSKLLKSAGFGQECRDAYQVGISQKLLQMCE